MAEILNDSQKNLLLSAVGDPVLRDALVRAINNSFQSAVAQWRTPVKVIDISTTVLPPTFISLTIDDINLVLNDRILFTNLDGSNVATPNNSVYIVKLQQNNLFTFVLSDAIGDQAPQDGDVIYIQRGTAYADSIWSFDSTDWNKILPAGGASWRNPANYTDNVITFLGTNIDLTTTPIDGQFISIGDTVLFTNLTAVPSTNNKVYKAIGTITNAEFQLVGGTAVAGDVILVENGSATNIRSLRTFDGSSWIKILPLNALALDGSNSPTANISWGSKNLTSIATLQASSIQATNGLSVVGATSQGGSFNNQGTTSQNNLGRLNLSELVFFQNQNVYGNTSLDNDFGAGGRTTILVDTTSSSITITLPNSPVGLYIIKDFLGNAGTNNIIINRFNTNSSIDGASSYTINTNYGYVLLIGYDIIFNTIVRRIWSIVGKG